MKILYVNAIRGSDTGEALKNGVLAGLSRAQLVRSGSDSIELVAYDIFYGDRRRPAWMGDFARSEGVDAIILSGSEKNTSDRSDPWVQEYERGLRDLLEFPLETTQAIEDPSALSEVFQKAHQDWVGPRVPVFGICFGHQALATSLGGATSRFSMKAGQVSLTALAIARQHPVFKQNLVLESTVPMICYHADQVVRVPVGFSNAFTSDHCEIQAMVHRQWPIVSVQPHPEVTSLLGSVDGEREEWGNLSDEQFDAHKGLEMLAAFVDWASSY